MRRACEHPVIHTSSYPQHSTKYRPRCSWHFPSFISFILHTDLYSRCLHTHYSDREIEERHTDDKRPVWVPSTAAVQPQSPCSLPSCEGDRDALLPEVSWSWGKCVLPSVSSILSEAVLTSGRRRENNCLGGSVQSPQQAGMGATQEGPFRDWR